MAPDQSFDLEEESAESKEIDETEHSHKKVSANLVVFWFVNHKFVYSIF